MRAQFPHFGSKFRYSGRTQYQVRDGREDAPKRPTYKINRKASTRFIGAKQMVFDSNCKYSLVLWTVCDCRVLLSTNLYISRFKLDGYSKLVIVNRSIGTTVHSTQCITYNYFRLVFIH